ncbi:MAG: ribulose-phosphate 3-epimerase [Deltaproteobacteria bacterium RBG_13_58_19]|nr:MAG: ribulose-phosphate 3-epimerase [Deltaproteobacteria bacterium RBG_13_58_19]
MKKLSVSILSADFGRLAEETRMVEQAGADWIHVDVMDGHFVPNLTVGPDVVRAIRRATTLPLDVHLMMDNPELYLEVFVDAGADWLGVHVEAAVHLERLVQRIKDLGAKAAVTLNPATPLTSLEVILPEVDMVLLMTVNPGFSGQKLLPGVLPKIRRLRQMIDQLGLPVLLEVDGGVNRDTIEALVATGAEVFVSGSGIFNEDGIAENIRFFKEKINPS